MTGIAMPRNELGAVRSAASAAADDAYDASGHDTKGSCQAASSADFSLIVTAASRTITRSTNGAISADSAYFDGVTLTAGSRVLVTQDAFGGASSAYAGIYYVSDAGAAGRPWVLVRAIDADGVGEVTPGMRTVIMSGTLFGSSGFQLTTPATGTITVGTTPIAFSQYSVSLAAGAGLTRTGRTIAIDQAWDGPTWSGTHVFGDIDVNGGAIDGTPIGGSAAAAGSFTTIAGASAVLTSTAVGTRGLDITGVANQTSHLAVITGGQAASGSLLVVAQYPNTAALKVDAPTGLVTAGLVDINGGTIDGTAIGGSSAAAGSFTALGYTAGYTATFPHPYISVSRFAAQTIGTGSLTAISWDTLHQNRGFTFSVHATTGTTITLPIAGIYMIAYETGEWSGTTGSRLAWVKHSASNHRYGADLRLANTDGTALTTMNGSFLLQAAASDTFQVLVFQNSGADQTIASGVNEDSANLQVLWLATAV